MSFFKSKPEKSRFRKISIIAGLFFLLVALVVLVSIFLFEKSDLKAAKTHTLRGWGWSENVGWISMNCFNDFARCVGGSSEGLPCSHDDDCPGGACGLDGVFENCCPGGNANQCPGGLADADYGVDYDTTYNTLSGWAWSENVGWICFGEDCGGTTPDGNSAWACVGNGSCNAAGVCSCTGDQGENFLDTDVCTLTSHLKAHWKMNDIIKRCVGGGNDGLGCTTDTNCPNGICFSFIKAENDVAEINLGTLMPAGTPSTLTKGKFGDALKFDGVNDYVIVEDSPSLSITGNLTIEAWIKRGDVNREQTIVAKWDETAGKTSYRLWFDDENKLNFTVSNNTYTARAEHKNGICVGSGQRFCYYGGVTNEQNCDFHADCPENYYCHERLCQSDNDCNEDLNEKCQNPPIIDTKKWHHVTGKYVADISGTNFNEKALLLFIDGSPVFVNITGTLPDALLDDSQNLYIGAKKGASGIDTYFKGAIDNVSVWSCQNLGKVLGRPTKEIWNDAKMEVDGWAKIVSLDPGGWLKLRGFTRDGRVWGSYLNKYNTFYTFSGYMANRDIQETVTNTGLAGYWKMNEFLWNGTTDEVVDSSGNDNHGMANKNGAKVTTNGILENAGDFDGENDCVLVPDSSTLDISSSITLNAWIFSEGIGVGTDSNWAGMIVAKHYTNNNRSYDLHLHYYTSGNKIRFEFYDPSNNQYYLESNSVIENQKWYHVAATYNYTSGAAKIYVNGELDNSATFSSYTLMQTSIPVSIGCYLNSTDGSSLRTFFSGLIDGVAIYNRALSVGEIETIYKSSVPYCAGWDDYDHEYGDPPAPLAFDSLSLNNTQGCGQMSLQWEISDWAESYTYERCDDVLESECSTCSYTERSVLDDSCEDAGCYLSDTDLISNTGYCYKVQAHNETGDTYNSEGPIWKSTLLCAPGFGEIDNAVCGQLSFNWESISGADSYNIYRSLTEDGCENVSNGACELIGHVSEAMDYDADNDVSNDLIAHWKMNESSWSGGEDEVYDSSGNGNHGTASSGTSTTSSGRFNYAGVFDGNDYVAVDHHEQFDLGENDKLTIEAWVYLSTAPTNYEMVLSKGYSPGYEFRINTGRYVQFLNVAPGYSSYSLTSLHALSLSEWHHVAVTKNNTTGETKLYLDGALDKTGILDILDYDNEGDVRIGRDADSGCANGNAYFKGYLDNMAFYNVVKTAEQIKIDYEAGICEEENCKVGELCHIYGVNDGLCGQAQNDPGVCCSLDSRIIPFVDYYYVFTAVSEQGESNPGPATPLTGQTICFPPSEEEEE